MIGGLQDAATEAAFSLGWRTIRLMPEFSGRATFRSIADTTYMRNGESVRQLRANLRRVRPDATSAELESLVRAGIRSYLRYWFEAFRLPSWSHQRIRDGFTLENVEILDASLAAGTGALMIPGHMANWDLAGAWAALRYGSVTTVAERLKPEGIYRQFLEYRRTLGIDVIGHGEPDIIRSLVRVLQSGRLVALLGDRDLGRNGVDVELFADVARIPGGPALLAILSGAPLHPVALWYDGPMLRGRVLERIEIPVGLERAEQVRVMTQQLADGLARGIEEHPADWHMMQKVWLADL